MGPAPAVWPRGGGQLWKDEQAAAKREALQQHGRLSKWCLRAPSFVPRDLPQTRPPAVTRPLPVHLSRGPRGKPYGPRRGLSGGSVAHASRQLVFVLLIALVAIVALVQILTRRGPMTEQQQATASLVSLRKGSVVQTNAVELSSRHATDINDNEDEEDPSDVANRALDALAKSNGDEQDSDEQILDDEADNDELAADETTLDDSEDVEDDTAPETRPAREMSPHVDPFLPKSVCGSYATATRFDTNEGIDAVSAKYNAALASSSITFAPGLLERSLLFPGTGVETRRVLTRAVKSSLYGERRAQEGSETIDAKYEDEEPFRILVLGGSVSNCRGVDEKTTCWHARVHQWFQDNLPMEGDVPSKNLRKASASGRGQGTGKGEARLKHAKRAVEVMQLPVQPPSNAGGSRRGNKGRRKGRTRKSKPRRRGQPVTRLINASKSATGSSFFAYCLEEELTTRRKNVEWHEGPDLVIVEVGINDVYPLDETATRDFEKLLRTLREMSSNPAVIVLEAASLLLAQTTPVTSNAEYLHLPAAQFYDVPVLSAKPALFGSVPALRASSDVKMEDLFLPDLHHPNERGHELLADILINYLERELCAVESATRQTAAKRLRKQGKDRGEVDAALDMPRRRDENVLTLPTRSLFTPFDATSPQSFSLAKPTCLQLGHDRSDVRPLSNNGWTKYAWARDKQYLVAEKPGSLVTFSVNVGRGGSILVDYLRSQFYNLGDVLVYLDGNKSSGKTLAGYWNLGWSIGVPTVVFEDVKPGRHSVSFELLDADSSSHPRHKTKFRLIGLIST
ncbi:hypothetical protein ACM66B_005820 [Microbotryomycetes sp. NB124-2]